MLNQKEDISEFHIVLFVNEMCNLVFYEIIGCLHAYISGVCRWFVYKRYTYIYVLVKACINNRLLSLTSSPRNSQTFEISYRNTKIAYTF